MVDNLFNQVMHWGPKRGVTSPQQKSLVPTLYRPYNTADQGNFIAGESGHFGFMCQTSANQAG